MGNWFGPSLRKNGSFLGLSEQGDAGGDMAPQDQLTLSQPGQQIMPTTLLFAPPGFSDPPTVLFITWSRDDQKITHEADIIVPAYLLM